MKIVIAATKTAVNAGVSKKTFAPTIKVKAATGHPKSSEWASVVPEDLTKNDPHLYNILRLMQMKKFPSEEINLIIKKCQQIRDAYHNANWSYDTDWPFFAELVIDTAKNQGGRPTLQFLTDHLKQTMAAVSAGLSIAPAGHRAIKKVRKKLGLKMRTRQAN